MTRKERIHNIARFLKIMGALTHVTMLELEKPYVDDLTDYITTLTEDMRNGFAHLGTEDPMMDLYRCYRYLEGERHNPMWTVLRHHWTEYAATGRINQPIHNTPWRL